MMVYACSEVRANLIHKVLAYSNRLCLCVCAHVHHMLFLLACAYHVSKKMREPDLQYEVTVCVKRCCSVLYISRCYNAQHKHVTSSSVSLSVCVDTLSTEVSVCIVAPLWSCCVHAFGSACVLFIFQQNLLRAAH